MSIKVISDAFGPDEPIPTPFYPRWQERLAAHSLGRPPARHT